MPRARCSTGVLLWGVLFGVRLWGMSVLPIVALRYGACSVLSRGVFREYVVRRRRRGIPAYAGMTGGVQE